MDKSPEAFRTISEVAEELDLPQHVLRFWETRFPQIKPLKRGGGRRYYRPDDVELLRAIKRLLYDEGYTIKGVQKLFKEQGAQALTNGAFDMRPAFEAATSAEFALSLEQDPDPATDGAAREARRPTATTPLRGEPSAPRRAADGIKALRGRRGGILRGD